jgi:hypothetical protein
MGTYALFLGIAPSYALFLGDATNLCQKLVAGNIQRRR